MGMFDTVYFENPIACVICQAPIISTQTKAFDCTLDNYRVGDCIAHAEEIRIVREDLHCDACHAFNQQFVYLAVYRGILVDIATRPDDGGSATAYLLFRAANPVASRPVCQAYG